MNEIRAFVGHSFTDADSEPVGIFLKYFEQISKSHPHFSWEHAEPAEPKQLAEKVISLLADKNVFIGICTRNEYVIDPSSLTTTVFRKGFHKAPTTAFHWKTSDWIIQEIGLAKGEGLDLILLIENGLRRPGGLQGDVEYIPFDRASPERSFGKILDMITALSPRVPSIASTTSDVKSVQDEEPRALYHLIVSSGGFQSPTGPCPTISWHIRFLPSLICWTRMPNLSVTLTLRLTTLRRATIGIRGRHFANSPA
jgi:hypothetical protein